MKREVELTIDVKKSEYDEIKLKQMDTTKLTFKMLDNSKEIDLTNAQARIIFTKPNQKIVIQSAIINNDKKSITADLKEDCVRNYGRGKIEVEILKDDEVLSSFYLNIRIEKTSKSNMSSDDTPSYFEEVEKTLAELKRTEETRVSNENNRIKAEKERVKQEENRINKEKEREEAENLREEAEKERAANIEKLKEENVALKKQNEDLKKDMESVLAYEPNEGEDLILKTTTGARFKNLSFKGNSYQETSSQGNNMIDLSTLDIYRISNLTVETREPNELKISGTAGTNRYIKFDLGVLKAGTYYFKRNYELISGTEEEGVVTGLVRFARKDNSQQFKDFDRDSDDGSFTINEDIDATLNFYISGSLGNKNDTTIKFSNIILSTENVPFEAFIPDSPSLKYQSKIKNCGDNKNLMPTSEESWEQGTIDTDGTLSVNTKRLRTKDFVEIKNVKEYIKIHNSKYSLINIHLYDKDKSRICDYNSEVESLSGLTQRALTFPKNARYLKAVLKNSDNTDITPNMISDIQIKLEEGNKATGYTPFDIGCVSTTIHNRELLNTKLVSSRTINELKVTNNDDQTIGFNGKVNNETTISFNSPIYFKKGKTYSAKIKVISGSVDDIYQFAISLYPGHNEQDFVRLTSDNPKENAIKFTCTENKTANPYLFVHHTASHGAYATFNNAVILFKVEEANKINDELEHQEQVVIFPTKEGQVFHKEDYLGDNETHHLRKTKTFNGNENWKNVENLKTFTIEVDDLKQEGEVISNYFKIAGTPRVETTQNGLIFYLEEELESLDAFKNMLKKWNEDGAPLTVEYGLTKEIIEPFSEEQKKAREQLKNAKTYEDMTYVLSTDDITPIFETKHYLRCQPINNEDVILKEESEK